MLCSLKFRENLLCTSPGDQLVGLELNLEWNLNMKLRKVQQDLREKFKRELSLGI